MARILIVEDEPDVRVALQDALRLQQHQVDVAANAEEALQRASTTTYDIAIIDYVLPGKRGLDLLQDLRKQNPFIRSIIISGQIDHDTADARDIERQLKEKVAADYYLAKPFAVDDLVRAIQTTLSPISGAAVDWRQVASVADAARRVKSKDVRELDKHLRRNRKRPRQ